MNQEFSVIGKAVPRVDALAKVTGRAVYAADLSLPGMLHGKILRSPYAHAKILNIDTSKAEKLPGVRAIVTGKDFPGIKFGLMPETRDQLPFPIDKVRHYGEGVAAVAAIDPDIAEEALSLIRVEYEELPPVLDPIEAMKEDSPLVHEHAPRNIAATCNFHFGDIDAAFREADYIREETFTTQRVNIGFIEPHAVLAAVEADGRITIRASKQSPYITWRHMARALGVPPSHIRIVQDHYVGGAFSGKHDPFDLDFAAVRLAQKTGRPVKIVLSQDEVLTAYRQRHSKIVRIKLGVKRDGTLLACDCTLIAEGGAYACVGPFNIYIFGAFLTVPYRLPNIKYEAYRVYTTKPPCGAVRGQSIPIARYAFESILDMVADDLGLDKWEIRRKNALRAGETTANKMYLSTCGMAECLDKLAEALNWEERKKKKVPYRGIGFSCGAHPSGVRLGGHFGSTALVKVMEDGTVTLIHGGTEIGQGADTVLAQIAAEPLGLDPQDVLVAPEDSDSTALDSGMFGDRCTLWTGNAVLAAAKDARRQLAEVAAEILDAPPDKLVFRDHKVYPDGQPEKAVTFLQVVRKAIYEKGQPIYGRGTWSAPGIEVVNMKTGEGNLTPAMSFIAQAAEVEVDPETGQVKVLKSIACDDSGQPINILTLDGQIEGGTVFAMGQALYEEAKFDAQGRPINASFRDYKMPTAMEAPEMETHHIVTNDPSGPFGAKGAGEASTAGTLGAIANAVADALGVRIKDLPITPEKIVEALRAKKEGAGRNEQ